MKHGGQRNTSVYAGMIWSKNVQELDYWWSWSASSCLFPDGWHHFCAKVAGHLSLAALHPNARPTQVANHNQGQHPCLLNFLTTFLVLLSSSLAISFVIRVLGCGSSVCEAGSYKLQLRPHQVRTLYQS